MTLFLKSGLLKRQTLFITILIFVWCFPVFVQASDSIFLSNKGYSKEKVQILYIVKRLKERIRANKHQIKTLGHDKDWLENRVMRLEDLGRNVPWKVYNSLEIKEKRIELALKENVRLKKLLKKKSRQLGSFGKVVKHKKKTAKHKVPSPKIKKKSESLKKVKPQKELKTKLAKNIESKIKKSDLGDWVQLAANGNSCKLENILPILFPSGSAKIADEYKAFFKKLSGMIKGHKIRIKINGYADSDKINTEKYPSNFELGASRAANIVHEFVKNGVNPSVFEIGSTGRYRVPGKAMSDKKILERKAEISIFFTS